MAVPCAKFQLPSWSRSGWKVCCGGVGNTWLLCLAPMLVALRWIGFWQLTGVPLLVCKPPKKERPPLYIDSHFVQSYCQGVRAGIQTCKKLGTWEPSCRTQFSFLRIALTPFHMPNLNSSGMPAIYWTGMLKDQFSGRWNHLIYNPVKIILRHLFGYHQVNWHL